MTRAIKFTNAEKQREAALEVGYRRHVYARLVHEGKMNKQQADRRIALMEEIADDYGELAERDEPKFPDSF